MRKRLIVICIVLVLVLLGFFIFENKITGKVTVWQESGCDSTYLGNVWSEIFYVGANTSGYFNEITNTEGSTNCEIHSYNYIDTKLYVLVLNLKKSGVKEELNYSAYYANLNGAGIASWVTVDLADSGQISSFFNDGLDNFWALRVTQLEDGSAAAQEFSTIFREKQNATGWNYNSVDAGFDMIYNNYTIPSNGEQNINLWTYLMKERELGILDYRDTRVENGSWFRSMNLVAFSNPSINQSENYTLNVENVVKGFTNFSVKTVYANQTNDLTIFLNLTGKKAELRPASNYVGTILLNLTASNYVDNASVIFSLVVRNLSGSGDNNTVPTLVKEFPDISIIKNTNYSINLTGYFSDADGDNLSYSTREGANVDTTISNMSLKVIPSKDFVGESWIMVVADDGIDLKSSNKINIYVFENSTQLALNQTNVTQQNQTINLTNNSVLKLTEEISNLPTGEQVVEEKSKSVDSTLLRSILGGLIILFLGLIGVVVLKRKELFGKSANANSISTQPGYANA